MTRATKTEIIELLRSQVPSMTATQAKQLTNQLFDQYSIERTDATNEHAPTLDTELTPGSRWTYVPTGETVIVVNVLRGPGSGAAAPVVYHYPVAVELASVANPQRHIHRETSNWYRDFVQADEPSETEDNNQ